MLNIEDEFSRLTDVCVSWSTSVPEYASYSNVHPEHTKYNITEWDKPKLLDQQKAFFDLLTKYDVHLHVVEETQPCFWQMYTRDTGFVINDTFFYCAERKLPERNGEAENVLSSLAPIVENNVVEITKGTIEGGDVLVHEGMAFVGRSARTQQPAIEQLSQHVEVVPLELGTGVMHLDTRMTILSNSTVLIYTPAFTQQDLKMLSQRFKLIEVTQAEVINLGTNVFVIDPKTIVAHAGHGRVIGELRAAGFKVEAIDYSEPIAIAGSFRCTTMPLVRQ